MKKSLSALTLIALAITLIVSSIATTEYIQKELLYDDIKITLDGKELIPTDINGNYVEPFIIEGTTYLPVRGIANALNMGVDWDGSTNTVILSSPSHGAADGQADGYQNKEAAETISVLKEYKWENDYGNYVALVVKNISDKTISPRVQMSFKTADGTVVGAGNSNENAFGSGNEMVFVFSNDEQFDSYDYIITSSEDKYYKECVSKLETKVSTTDTKAIIQITNNGDETAKYVQYTILFKKGDTVVDYGWGYCTDDDSEIKPGMTEMKEETVTYKQDFDSVEIYLSGRSDK